MGVCLSRSGENHAPFFPNDLQNEVHGDDYAPLFPNEFHGGGNTKSLDELDVLKQSMVDCSSAMIEGKHELSSPEKFQVNSENPDSQNSSELDCKENRTCRLHKSRQKNMKRREKLKTRSKNSSSCSEEIFSHGSLKYCTERHLNSISVDCENMEAETGEEDADSDEISFGHKTGEILEFFREYSSNTTPESPQSRPKLQIYSILDIKKLKSIRLSQFSKSSRFGSSNSETESPRSKLVELLMKNLSSRSKWKWSADKNLGDMKSACDYSDKSDGQKELVQEDKKHNGGRRQCLLSMFNVDRSFSIEGNTETLIFADHNNTKNEVFNNLMVKQGDFRIPVKTLSNEFVMFNFFPNEGGGDSAKLEHQLQGVCRRLSRLSLTEEDAAFGSPFSIGRGRRSKGPEISEDLILGRVSADAFSDSSSDLFELEFLGF